MTGIMQEEQDSHEKVVVRPTEWEIECPKCGDLISTEMEEQLDGGYECEDSERFTSCHCGKLIEIIGRWRNLP